MGVGNARGWRFGVTLAAAALLLAWWSLGSREPASPQAHEVAPALPRDGAAVAPVPPVVERPAERVVVEVECQLSDAVNHYTGVVVDEVDPDTLEVIRQHVPATDGTYIRFTPVNVDGLGWIRSRRHRPRTLGWIEGACVDLVELEPLPVRTVKGTAEGQIEVGGVSVHASCEESGRAGFSGSLDADGAFELTTPVDEVCDLVVRRVFAGRELESEPLPVPAGEHDLEDVELVVPEAPSTGMGLYPVDGGLKVFDLEVGSPAERAGVRKQDVVVAIDGEPADGLDPLDIQEIEGAVLVEVERDGELVEIEIVDGEGIEGEP